MDEEFSKDFLKDFVKEFNTAKQQLKHLALDIDDIKKMPGKVLVTHCGKKASLVEYLRDKDIEAYGMDARLQKTAPYLIKQHIFDIKPRRGHVPFKDNTFVKVITYMNTLISDFNRLHYDFDYDALDFGSSASTRKRKRSKQEEEIREENLKESAIRATLFLSELIRVTNNVVGQLYIYPYIGALEQSIGHLTNQSGYTILKEPIKKGTGFEFFHEICYDEPNTNEFLNTLDYCTIIQPKDIISMK